jgi:hypothetical protein
MPVDVSGFDPSSKRNIAASLFDLHRPLAQIPILDDTSCQRFRRLVGMLSARFVGAASAAIFRRYSRLKSLPHASG